MTAISDGDGARVHLFCDGCGTTAVLGGCGMHDSKIGYVSVAMIGWSGSTFARGPHRCPACGPGPVGRVIGDEGRAGKAGVAVSGTAVVVRMIGSLGPLQAVLREMTGARRTVIVDLSGLTECDTADVANLVRARNTVLQRGGDLLLAAPPPALCALLRVRRLHTAFRIFRSVQHATAATQPATRALLIAGRRGLSRLLRVPAAR